MKAFLLLLLCLPISLVAQKSAGIDYQGYPTGNIIGLRFETGLGQHQSIDFRLATNNISERTEGEQDIEEGSGFGGSVGYRYYLNETQTKWFGSFRTDVWFSTIDWQDITLPVTISGSTNITVLQPTLYGGYVFEVNESWRFTPTLGGGVEFNIKEDSRPVGEGPITLWGINIEKVF